jgi:rSAM/selenodomain-associated transferase 2
MATPLTTPRLSIILPVLNEAPTLRARLEALRAQTDNAEIIVVDGGSEDASFAAAIGCADQVLCAQRGRGAQLDAGARAASGELLLFLHADTRLPVDAVATILNALAQGAHWGRFDVRIEGRSWLLPVVARLMNGRSRLTGIATGDQAMFMTRNAYEQAGGFAPLPLMEDIDLSARLKRLGRPACLRARVVTSGRRWDENGALRTIILMWRLRLLFWLGIPAQELVRLYGR